MKALDPRIDQICLQCGASRRVAHLVQAIMSDGIPRTDWEIWRVVTKPPASYVAPDTIRHARLALEEAGFLAWTGERARQGTATAKVWKTRR